MVLSEKLDRRVSAIVSGLLKQADSDIIANQQNYEIERVGGSVRSIRLAGMSMTGSDIKYSGFLSLMNTVEILDVPVFAIGMINPVDKGYDVFIEEKDGAYRKLVFKNEIPKWALFINSTEKSGAYTYMIKNQLSTRNLKNLAIQGGLGDSDLLKMQADALVA